MPTLRPLPPALTLLPLAVLAALGGACAGEPGTPPPEPEPPPEPAAAPAEPPPPPVPPADPNVACGRMLLVAYAGAAHAPDTVKRDKAAAKARALELLGKLQAGADFAQLAAAESDAPSSAARDGIMGTYEKDEWPKLHEALRDPLFALEVGQVGKEPVEADYGYALLQRCAVEKARSRHILLRYAGAKNADPKLERTKAEAKQKAEALLEQLKKGGDFAALAQAESDDASKERGGDLGVMARGLLAPAYDKALFGMGIGQRAVVETEFGFHVVERTPELLPRLKSP